MFKLSSQIIRARFAVFFWAAMVVAIGIPAVTVSAQKKLKVEDVVAKHLEALGSAEARNKSRIIQGTAIGNFPVRWFRNGAGRRRDGFPGREESYKYCFWKC